MNNPLKLDHITVVARNLEEGCAYIKDQLGIEMPEGGAHLQMGTHNKLLSLGDDVFLELIAVDPTVKSPDRRRWFNLDDFKGDPKLATWVLATNDIEETLKQAHPASGQAVEVARGVLSWLISVPETGVMPLDGAFPTFIEWPEGSHPASGMADLGCRLVSLTIEHPEAEEILSLIGQKIDCGVTRILFSSEMKITAVIQTHEGLKTLT